MEAPKIRKLIDAVMPCEPESYREEKLKRIAEEALEELEELIAMSQCKTITR